MKIKMDHLKTSIDSIRKLKWAYFNEQFLPAVIEHKRRYDSQFSNLLEQLWGTERVLCHLSSSTLEAYWPLFQELDCVLGRAITLVKEVRFKSQDSTSSREHDTGEHCLEAFLDLRWWTWMLIYIAPLRTASHGERFLVTLKGVLDPSSSRLPSFMQKLGSWWSWCDRYSRHLPSYGVEVFVQETEGLSSFVAWLKPEDGIPLDRLHTTRDLCSASAEQIFIIEGMVLVQVLNARKPSWVGDEFKVDLTQVFLGMSSSGLVIKCKDSGTEYALKRVQNLDHRQPALARLSHPNIVQLMSYWRENGFLFLMMELMEGNLKDLIRRRLRVTKSPFIVNVVLDILLQIAKAMLYLHDMGLTHPHLKSSDVLFKETADRSKLDKNDHAKHLVKLGDFQFVSQSNNFESMAQQNVYQFGLICLEILSTEPLQWELEERVMGMSKEPNAQFTKIQDRLGYAFPGSLTHCITRCLDGSIMFSEVVVMLLLVQVQVLMRATIETPPRPLDSEHLVPAKHQENERRGAPESSTVNPGVYLDITQAPAANPAMLPSKPPIKLRREQCSCLQQKLGETLELVVRRGASYKRVPVQYKKVFEEIDHLVQKVNTFVDDCCYENENDFVLAAIRVIAHRKRFFQYHVELDWCSFLVECLWEADNLHHKPVYCQTLQKFDWEQKFKSLLHNSMVAADEGELEALLESWIAKPGEHQAICWTLLRRLGSETDSDLHIMPSNLGFPPIPTTLGKFIGAGSYGHVHEIKWKEKLFAVKCIPIDNVETVSNEVKILEHCCHPHIVSLILAHKEDTTQYLMMERLPWDLQSYVDERKKRRTFPFPTLEVVDMISQICEGMLYLNDPGRNVSHRSLTPRNILVKELKPVTDSEIPAIELQVADFGMAKVRKEKGSGNTPNCGTLLYRAPEMTAMPGVVRIRASSMKADIYSFAITCSFILTGTAPFSDYTNTKSLKQAVKDGARPHLPDNYPLALATLLEWCWNSDPTKRPESFYEILSELRILKANLLTGAIERVELADTEEAPEVAPIERTVEPPGTAPEPSFHPRYDVFINRRGPDVKNEFLSHLYAALRGAGLRPFVDVIDIEHDPRFFNSMNEALQGSLVHVAIFSEGYADSKHCLEELCDMLKSGKGILPVFYHVDPADLRRVENGPFKEGFRKHSERETEEQISKWKEALRKISQISGLRLDEVNGNEAELVRRIVAAVRQLMPIVLPGAIERVELADTEEGAVEGVEPRDTKAPVEQIVTFNPGDRRLNILVLGDLESVEAVVSHICGARRHQTLVQGHLNLTESRNSWPPMCLYGVKKGINRNDYTDIRTFVKVRNGELRRTKVEALWLKEVHRSGPRNQSALFPDSTLRLHMVWFACRKLSDLPNHLEWSEITEKLCDLPVQILVIEKQNLAQDLDVNSQEEFHRILVHGNRFFPNAQKFMEDLIVKVDLQDDDLQEKLWRKCWAVKTRVEIENAAKIIREIRKRLGPAGISIKMGVGGVRLRKEVSLSRSAEFVLDFLCSYWGIPRDILRRVLQRSTTFNLQASGSKFSIKPRRFVEFCLIVAAIILYNAGDNARNPKYACIWNTSSESSLAQLQTDARDCYNSYFASSSNLSSSSSESSPYYDTMGFEDIRLFLQSVFERVWYPRPVVSVDRDSIVSKMMNLISPRGNSGSRGMTPPRL